MTQSLEQTSPCQSLEPIFTAHSETILQLDAQGKLCQISVTGDDLTAELGQAFINAPFEQILPAAIAAPMLAAYQQLTNHRRVAMIKCELTDREPPLTFEVTFSPLAEQNSLVLLRDITEHKNLTQPQTLQRDTNAASTDTNNQNSQENYFKALHELTLGLLNNLDSTNLFQYIVDEACRLLDCSQGYISLVLPDGENRRMVAGRGEIYEAMRFTNQPKNAGMTGEVLVSGKTTAVDSYAGYGARLRLPVRDHRYPVAIAPLFLNGVPVGALALMRAQIGDIFKKEQINILDQFAELASVVYQKAELMRNLRDQREFDQRIMQSIGQGLAILYNHQAAASTSARAIDYINPAFLRMLGYLPDETIDTSLLAHVYKDDRAEIEKQNALREKGITSTYECRFVHRNGGIVYTLITGVPMYADGIYIGTVIVVTDLTERKQKETDLHLLESAVVNANDAIVMTEIEPSAPNRGRRILYVNDAFTRMTGYEPSEVMGRSLGSLQGPRVDRDKLQEINRAHQRREPIRVDFINFRKDGRPFWQESSYVPVKNDKDVFTHWVIVMRDTTDRHRAEEILQEAKNKAEEASLMKSQFIAIMSHELRTPMNAILGYADLLFDTPLTSEQNDFVKTIYDSGNNLLEYINELLEFSRMEAGRFRLDPEDFDLVETVEHVVNLLKVRAQEKHLFFFHKIAYDLPRKVHGDPKRLRQILLNLCGNAIKFTAQGMINLRMWRMPNEERGQISIRCEISDTGIGISKEAQKTIFEPFIQAEQNTSRTYGGTGLGLAICRNLVEMMDGEIGVTSELGHGSTFWFNIIVDAI
ncbi:MAG: PAS domain-containing protein [Anaerolineae bacterium]|nr:PAS domain-containing protein [Anaerolineae bacterium]